MKSNNEISQKLKAMGMSAVTKVIVDALLLHDQVHDAVHDIHYYQLIVNELRKSYQRELKVEDVVSKQRDLENLIMSINDGGDKFVNKMIKNGTETE